MPGAKPEQLASPARHCWECLRRDIACDGTYPVCKTCAGKEVVCPGYDNTKPLRWLTPGKVTSRTGRKKKCPSTKTGNLPKPHASGKREIPSPSQVVLKVEADALIQAVKYCESLNPEAEISISTTNTVQSKSTRRFTHVIQPFNILDPHLGCPPCLWTPSSTYLPP